MAGKDAMSTAPGTGSYITPPSARADKDAIIADLLAALKAMLRQYGATTGWKIAGQTLGEARAAIARAEGTASERTDSAGEKRSSTP